MTPPRVVFVCWGNICRSPMAERVAKKAFEDAGVPAVITSAGVSSEEYGNPMDPRAVRVLSAHGYDTSPHRVHKITADDIDRADLVIAAEPLHVTRLQRLAPDAEHIQLISDFDPDAAPGTPLPDPWYGPASGFEHTLSAIEQAMPGIVEAVRGIDP